MEFASGMLHAANELWMLSNVIGLVPARSDRNAMINRLLSAQPLKRWLERFGSIPMARLMRLD